MKLFLHKEINWLLSIVALLCIGDATAQSNNDFKISYNFKYEEGSKEGKIEYWVYYSTPTLKRQYTKDPNNFKIEMDNASEGILVVEIKLSDRFDKNYKIILPYSCTRGTQQFKLKGGRTIMLDSSHPTEKLTYDIKANGSGTLKIGFDALPITQKEPGNCNSSLKISYNIGGMPDLAADACDEAMSAFRSNMDNLDKINDYMAKYPDGNCMQMCRRIVNESGEYQQLKASLDRKDCDQFKKLKETYNANYPNGYYKDKVAALAECKSNPPEKETVTKPPIGKKEKPTKESEKTTPPPSPNCDKHWEAVKNEPCAQAYKDFIAKNPNCDRIKDAEEKLQALSNANFSVSLSTNSATISDPGGNRLKWKDLSSRAGLSVEKAVDGKGLKASFREGTYFLYVEDDCGRNDTVELRSGFYASLDQTEKNKRLTITIFGGNPPYNANLLSSAGNRHPIPPKFFDGNVITFTKKDMDNRRWHGNFAIEIKDAKLNSFLLKNRIINEKNAYDLGKIIISLLLLIAVGLLMYLFFTYFKTKKRKETIYDIEY